MLKIFRFSQLFKPIYLYLSGCSNQELNNLGCLRTILLLALGAR